MKTYIFYTKEGKTQDNFGKDIENCQILGWSREETPQKAFKNLMKENKYLEKTGFDEIMCQELVSDQVSYFSLKT